MLKSSVSAVGSKPSAPAIKGLALPTAKSKPAAWMNRGVVPRLSGLPQAPFLGLAAAGLLALGLPAGPAMAAKISAPFENVSYEEVACASKPKGGFTCVKFSGSVTNKDKDTINTADIYGRIYDNAKNDVTDNEENDRIGYVDVVPPGTSTVSFELPVAKSQLALGPLEVKGLKLSGYTGKVLPGQAGLLGLPTDGLDCSAISPDSDPLDIEACDEQEAELAIR